MVRLGATPCEVFGNLGDAQNDRVLPDARSYRESAKLPFGRPQNHLREWQQEIDLFLARHPRAHRATPPA